MSEKSGKPGCLGIFLKTLIVSLFLLGGAAAGFVALGIRFFNWNIENWTQLSSWSSYPVMVGIGVVSCSLLAAFTVATFISLASAFLGKGRAKSHSSSISRARPQSQRKTTI